MIELRPFEEKDVAAYAAAFADDPKLANLLGNFQPAAAYDFVVYPKDDNNVTVPAIFEAHTQLGMSIHEPSLTNDSLHAGDHAGEEEAPS